VFDVLREELDLLNPARLADELGEVHAALRAAIAAYDPAVLAADVDGLIDGVAADLRGLNPASLLPDLSGVRAQVQRLPNLLPVQALTDAGAELQEVGGQLVALDVQGLLDTANALAPAVTDAFLRAIEAVKQELLTLLRSIRYASTSASASVSVGVSVG
jgi:predicted component of type VI protein secretion system